MNLNYLMQMICQMNSMNLMNKYIIKLQKSFIITKPKFYSGRKMKPDQVTPQER